MARANQTMGCPAADNCDHVTWNASTTPTPANTSSERIEPAWPTTPTSSSLRESPTRDEAKPEKLEAVSATTKSSSAPHDSSKRSQRRCPSWRR